MSPLELELPENSQVSNRLYPSPKPEYLLQDLIVVELANGIIIDAGWYPEHDPKGEYVVRVYSPQWSEQIGSTATATHPLAVREMIEHLAKKYSKDVTGSSASAETVHHEMNNDGSSNWLVSTSC